MVEAFNVNETQEAVEEEQKVREFRLASTVFEKSSETYPAATTILLQVQNVNNTIAVNGKSYSEVTDNWLITIQNRSTRLELDIRSLLRLKVHIDTRMPC